MIQCEKRYKTVLMPIDVPEGEYCWNGDSICPHFNNEGGHPVCALNLGPLDCDKEERVPKPLNCLKLEGEE